jgi:hypothetical protein
VQLLNMTAHKEGRGGGPGPGPGPGSEPRGGHNGNGSAGDGYHGAANYTPHWTTRAFDTAKLFSLQLVTIGGSGALAKTAVAPLERVKAISPALSLSCPNDRPSNSSRLERIAVSHSRPLFANAVRGHGVLHRY